MPTLDWLNRDESFRIAQRVPTRVLRPHPAAAGLGASAGAVFGDVSGAASGNVASGNLLLQGDNLDALKALLPFYRGRVKCIFIDPPYNTKSAFEHYDDNLEHSQWLTMMLPRLQLLRELLSDDGSIWVTIDDNEGHYLKVLMDEVFGRRNFVTTFIWQKVDSPNDNKVSITPDHEFVLAYAKSIAATVFKRKRDPSLIDAYGQVNESGLRYRDRLLKKNGKNSLRSDRPTMFYALTAPDGSTVFPVHDDGREANWALGTRGVQEAASDGRLIWKQRTRSGASIWIPYTREFAPESPERPHPTILLDVKTSRQAKAHQRELLPDTQQFDTVKPEQLIERLLDIVTNPNDLVLDSFLGSATTAAVAHKMGRRWIGIEMGEHAVTHCVPRLKKVLDGEQGGISAAVNWQGGGGFRFMALGAPLFDANGEIDAEVRFADLAAFIWMRETGSALEPAAVTRGLPLIGTHASEPGMEATAYYLLFNGILGDRRPASGNVLTSAVLAALNASCGHAGPKVVYGEACRLGDARLAAERITFRQLPHALPR